jgi:hypothetical protein
MSVTTGNRHTGRTGVYPDGPREPVVSRLRAGIHRSRGARWLDAAGQTTTEWLMIAGGLTAIGIFLNGILPRTIRQFCRALVWSIRVIAP